MKIIRSLEKVIGENKRSFTKGISSEIEARIKSINKEKKRMINSISQDLVLRTKLLNKNPEQKIKQIYEIRDQMCEDIDYESSPNILSVGRDFYLKMIEFSTFDIEGLYDELYSKLVNIKNIEVVIYAGYVYNYDDFMNSYKNGCNSVKIMLPNLIMNYLRRDNKLVELYKDTINEDIDLISKIEPHREQIISKYNESLEKMKLSKRNPILYNDFMSIVNYYQIFYYTYIKGEIFNGEIDDFIDFVINTPGLLVKIENVISEHRYNGFCYDFSGEMWYYYHELPSKFQEATKSLHDIYKNVLKIIYNTLYFTQNNLPFDYDWVIEMRDLYNEHVMTN